jgi:hypothetical protein
MTILAADLLAMRVSTLLAQLAYAGNWPPAEQLKAALETYAAVRAGGELIAAQEQASDEPAPALETLRSAALDRAVAAESEAH